MSTKRFISKCSKRTYFGICYERNVDIKKLSDDFFSSTRKKDSLFFVICYSSFGPILLLASPKSATDFMAQFDINRMIKSVQF